MENITDTDKISELPECIIHDILSFFDSPTDLVRMSVLSKRWFALTASFPIINLNLNSILSSLQSLGVPFDTLRNSEYIRATFYKYVEYTTSRICEQNVSIHTFKLITVILEPTDTHIIDSCLELILKKGVRVLVIDITSYPYTRQHFHGINLPMYRVPNILLSASSLTSLTIHSCKLPLSLIVDVVEFKSLKLLYLDNVPLDEEAIKHLTTGSPLLEEFNARLCYGFKSFSVYRHEHLQKVGIYFNYEVERIDIEAPNLWCLLIVDVYELFSLPQMNLASCKKLTTLCFYGNPSADFLSNFPFLETFSLHLHDDFLDMVLSDYSFRTLVLHSACYFEEIADHNTPNFSFFECPGYSNITFPFVRTSVEESKCMEYYQEKHVRSNWFHNLRLFLDRNNEIKVLKLHIHEVDLDVEKVKMMQRPPYELEHVELDLDFLGELSVYVDVVDAVLWCCVPRSLSLYLPNQNFEEPSLVFKFTYEKLLQQEDQGQTKIQIVLSSSSEPKENFSNVNSLLAALRGEHTVTFIKNFTIKVDVDSTWQKTVKKVLKSVKGVTTFRMEDNGMINISGYIDPSVVLCCLSKARKEARIVHWQFGECSSNLYDTSYGNNGSSGYYSYPNYQINNSYNHSSDYGYSNYASGSSGYQIKKPRNSNSTCSIM